MVFQWETEKEKLLRFMKVTPKKKMEWLYQMHEFLRKASTKRQRDIFQRLREIRQS